YNAEDGDEGEKVGRIGGVGAPIVGAGDRGQDERVEKPGQPDQAGRGGHQAHTGGGLSRTAFVAQGLELRRGLCNTPKRDRESFYKRRMWSGAWVFFGRRLC